MWKKLTPVRQQEEVLKDPDRARCGEVPGTSVSVSMELRCAVVAFLEVPTYSSGSPNDSFLGK